MNSPISVSTLNEQIKGILETTFSSVYVEGEISNLTYHNSGHIYFSVKDSKSTISCVMFRGNAQYLKFRLEVGQKIVISGNITVYTPRGNYQLLCTKIEPSGVGALALAFEQLKTKLQIKGYFDKSIKKELPKYPNNIYVITSNTGAAIEDMKKILSSRYPLAKMILLPTLVQGVGAKEDIVKNIKRADKLAQDLNIRSQAGTWEREGSLIIVGRGGGSIEDLWAFNEEIVADAVFETTIPIISAVGHESDFVISDFVADVRASTPSNAIEISTPNINDLRQYLDTLSDDYTQKQKTIIFHKEQVLKHLKSSFMQHSLEKKFESTKETIVQLKQQFKSVYSQLLYTKKQLLNNIINSYDLNHPNKKDKKGFVQLTQNNSIVDLQDIEQDDTILLQNSNFVVECKVISKNTINFK
ncbi:MAG: exodeoxyribonuclease VII large subunit [Campylobacterota bacterium]|nr:exodeoxyribonuclease VII large subunit [Campylobacterota bacterium]